MGKSYFRGKLSKAKVYKSGQYIVPGDYDLEIITCKMIESDHDDRTFFVAEFTILSCDDVEDDKYKAGDECSWLVDMGKKSALSNIKAFILALDPEIDPASDDVDDLAEAIVDEERRDGEDDGGPAAGICVRAHAYMITTRAGAPFTKVSWQPLDAAGEED